ncbi:MAG: DUF1232 domain-containing protein [Pseudanabaena sp.]|nr:MAG: DUF1232 domain-containing protein [Pseudanabaena sp.]
MDDFLKECKSFVGHVPFIKDIVTLFYTMTDPRTPIQAKLCILAALTYFLSPADAIPDVIVAVGFTDDATVASTTFLTVTPCVTEEHRLKAEEFFAS